MKAHALWGPWPVIIILFLGLTLTGGCGKSNMAGPGEKIQDPYPAVLEQWTSRAKVYRGLDFMLEVTGTYKSAPFRRAYAEKFARDFQLSPQATAKMLSDEKAMAEKNIEFILAVSAPDEKKDNLKAGDSAWRIFLASESMGQIKPFEIRLVKKRTARLEEFYPYISPWAKVYLVRFLAPPHPPLSEPLDLVLTGVLGSARLTFQAKD